MTICNGMFRSVGIKTGSSPVLLRHIRPVAVLETWKRSLAPSASIIQNAIQSWGFFGSKGDVSMRCELDRPMFGAGSNVFVKLEIDNTSGKKVTNFDGTRQTHDQRSTRSTWVSCVAPRRFVCLMAESGYIRWYSSVNSLLIWSTRAMTGTLVWKKVIES